MKQAAVQRIRIVSSVDVHILQRRCDHKGFAFNIFSLCNAIHCMEQEFIAQADRKRRIFVWNIQAIVGLRYQTRDSESSQVGPRQIKPSVSVTANAAARKSKPWEGESRVIVVVDVSDDVREPSEASISSIHNQIAEEGRVAVVPDEAELSGIGSNVIDVDAFPHTVQNVLEIFVETLVDRKTLYLLASVIHPVCDQLLDEIFASRTNWRTVVIVEQGEGSGKVELRTMKEIRILGLDPVGVEVDDGPHQMMSVVVNKVLQVLIRVSKSEELHHRKIRSDTHAELGRQVEERILEGHLLCGVVDSGCP